MIESNLISEDLESMSGLDKSLDFLDKEVDKAMNLAKKIVDIYSRIGSEGETSITPNAKKMFGATKPNPAEEVARKAIKVASDICVFTNNNLNIEKI